MSQKVPNHWRIICGYLPVGGPDGQWRVKQICKGLMPADVDRKRKEWDGLYAVFVLSLTTTTIKWTATQDLLLRLLADQAACLFRPRADRELRPPTSIVIRYDNEHRTGLTTALVHFQRMLVVYMPSGLLMWRYSGFGTMRDVTDGPRVSWRGVLSRETMPLESAYPDVIVCDDWWSVQSDKSVLLRPGGVCFLVTRVEEDHTFCTYTDRELLTKPLKTPYRYIELDLHGNRKSKHYVNAIDMTNVQSLKLLDVQHSANHEK
jgi:hypothetical protein